MEYISGRGKVFAVAERHTVELITDRKTVVVNQRKMQDECRHKAKGTSARFWSVL